ncbi:unnamed protein product [Aureobasidium mustum]|uniref:Uncharacterized protein n=1 Tax=Aureobasidium mustum TaxID=2773714 RepID=A0A9N8K5H2_9PEZI|nr:unnamed protein product [Aureobasidium mustum]
MGNCFGKQKSDNFSGAGQTLGATQPAKPVVSASQPQKPISASYSPTPKQGRTVGGGSASPSSDPRAAAALAAEPAKGKLGKQLEAQKAQTHNATMNEASREALLARNADANAETRAYN